MKSSLSLHMNSLKILMIDPFCLCLLTATTNYNTFPTVHRGRCMWRLLINCAVAWEATRSSSNCSPTNRPTSSTTPKRSLSVAIFCNRSRPLSLSTPRNSHKRYTMSGKITIMVNFSFKMLMLQASIKFELNDVEGCRTLIDRGSDSDVSTLINRGCLLLKVRVSGMTASWRCDSKKISYMLSRRNPRCKQHSINSSRPSSTVATKMTWATISHYVTSNSSAFHILSST